MEAHLSLIIGKVSLDHHDCCQGTEQAHDHGSRRVPLLVLHQGCHEECSSLKPYDPPSELQVNDRQCEVLKSERGSLLCPYPPKIAMQSHRTEKRLLF